MGLCLGLCWVTFAAVADEPLKPLRPDLWAGGQPDRAQLEQFAKDGGTVVIDLRMPDEDRGLDEAKAVAELGLTYVNLPIDSHTGITADNARALHEALAAASALPRRISMMRTHQIETSYSSTSGTISMIWLIGSGGVTTAATTATATMA